MQPALKESNASARYIAKPKVPATHTIVVTSCEKNGNLGDAARLKNGAKSSWRNTNRRRWLVTGFDLGIFEERSFYMASIVEALDILRSRIVSTEPKASGVLVVDFEFGHVAGRSSILAKLVVIRPVAYPVKCLLNWPRDQLV